MSARSWLSVLDQFISMDTRAQKGAARRRSPGRLPKGFDFQFEKLEARLLLTVSLDGVPDWVSLGAAPQLNGSTVSLPNSPASGGVEDLAIDPDNPGRMFAGTINGGIWMTTDGDRPFDGIDNDGANGVDDPAEQPTWIPLTDQYATLSIGDIRFDPLDGTDNTIFAGTGSASSLSNRGGPSIGVMRTTDGGASWTVTPLNPGGAEPQIRAILPTTVDYDLVAGGIQQVVFAGTVSNSNGLYRSTDGGASYNSISGTGGLPNGPVTDLRIDPNNPSRIFAGVVGDGVFFTDDGGDSWTATDNGSLNVLGSQVIQLTAHPGGGTTVWHTLVSGPNPAAYISSNSGSTWTQLAAIPAAFSSGFNNLYTDMASDQIIVDPSGASDVVYIAKGYGGNSIYRYDPSGPNWDQLESVAEVNNSSPHVDHRDLQFVGNNLITANDGGLYFLSNPSNPAGNQWTSLHGYGAGGLNATEFTNVAWDSTFNVVYGGAQDNGTSVQNGFLDPVWTSIRGADGGDAAVDTVNAGPGRVFRYTSTQNFGLQRHTFDSATNQPVGAVLLVPGAGLAGHNNYFVPQYELNSANPSRLVTGGTGVNPVYELLNADSAANAAAANWVAVPVGAGFGNVNGVNGNGGDAPFVVGGRRGGANNEEVLIVGSGSRVFVRSTAGGTLTATSAAFPGGTVLGIAVDPEDWMHMFVTDGAGVWESLDAGSSWTNVTENLAEVNNQIRSIAYVPTGTDDVIAVGGNLGVSRLAVGVAGAQWTRFGGNLPNALVSDLSYDATDDVLLAGTFGRGAWLTQNAATLVTEPGVLTIVGDMDFAGQNDNILLVLDANNPLLLNVFVNGASYGPFVLDTIGQILVDGVDGNDTLTVDNLYGLVDVPLGISYEGGTGIDTLVVDNATATYTPDPGDPNDPGRGSLDMEGAIVEFVHTEYVTPVNPEITSITLDNSDIDENETVMLTTSFIDPGTLSSHAVVINWGDGSSNSVFNLPVGNRSFSVPHQYLDDDPTVTTQDNYLITVTITDNDSLSDSDDTGILVRNVAPVVQLDAAGTISEDGTHTQTGTFTDPGVLDEHSVVIDWGDPNDAANSTFAIPATSTLAVNDTFNSSSDSAVLTVTGIDLPNRIVAFSIAAHQYLDDGISPGNGTASDFSSIVVTVGDDDSLSGNDNVGLLVENVEPFVTSFVDPAPIDDKAEEGELLTLSLDFDDPGSLDVHTVTVDWGDGTVDALVLPLGARTASADHAYVNGGIFPITVTVDDDDTGSDGFNTTAFVTGVGILNGELQIVGSALADLVSVSSLRRSQIRVNTSFIPERAGRIYDLNEIDYMVAVLCEGDDHMNVSGRIAIDSLIDAGGGNDHINGGSGSDIILGRDGDDFLNGGGGFDMLIGGAGADILVGGPGSDLLFGGIFAANDDGGGNPDESFLDDGSDLRDLQALWNHPLAGAEDRADDVGNFDSFFSKLFDDGSDDLLTGSSGDDWFLLFDADVATDFQPFKDLLTTL